MNNEIKEINGAWYLNGVNLYASSRAEAEKFASEIRPCPATTLPAGSLAAYTSGSYDRKQTVAASRARRARRGRR